MFGGFSSLLEDSTLKINIIDIDIAINMFLEFKICFFKVLNFNDNYFLKLIFLYINFNCLNENIEAITFNNH